MPDVAGGGAEGLRSVDARARLVLDGPNVLPSPRPPPAWRRLAAQMVHFFALMLWVAGVLAFIANLPQLGVAIFVVIVVNGVFAFVQETRAEHAAERLSDLLPRRAMVLRDGATLEIDAAELVVHDLVLLAAGDRVSADLRVTEAHALLMDTSLLTGESVPVPAVPHDGLFAGTFVVEGEGRAVVEATGANTRLAAIAQLTQVGRRPRSPLAHELDRVVRIVGLIAVGVGFAFFGVALVVGSPASDGFLFAIGVTVALVPEGLLPTVTLSLAMGAQRMAGRNALVRRLEAVETLGSTTFICTDKTGTLTRNEMAVVEVWTPAGTAHIASAGYDPTAALDVEDVVVPSLRLVARAAVRCSTGRAVQRESGWVAQGDPMEAAIDTLAAVEQGRATFSNVHRFLTYHLTDNVAELTPFVVWALSGGRFPLALGVLQILCLDIGTDLLPALALGAEPPNTGALDRPPMGRHLIDGALLRRVFGVLGPTEAIMEMTAFIVALMAAGWRPGQSFPTGHALLAASGAAFAAVVIGQTANAFACRSATRWPGALGWTGNRLLLGAAAVELALLAGFLLIAPVASLLDHAPPPAAGFLVAALTAPAVLGADALHKRARAGRRRVRDAQSAQALTQL